MGSNTNIPGQLAVLNRMDCFFFTGGLLRRIAAAVRTTILGPFFCHCCCDILDRFVFLGRCIWEDLFFGDRFQSVFLCCSGALDVVPSSYP
jgi:hypothetical protein